jgi:hypothetical protein
MISYLFHRLPSMLLRTGAALLGLLLFAPAMVRGQDAVRPSLAGEEASEARRQDIDRLPYNLLMGPVRFRFGATIGVEYNDNINIADDNDHATTSDLLALGFPKIQKGLDFHGNKEEDFIFHPQVNFDAIWPITQLNTLRLDLGIGYNIYVDHSNENTNGVLISPGSQLAFDIFVGDFRINIHERPQIQQDPVDQAAVSNVVDYGRFENTAGLSVLWDLNKVLVSVGYDHYNYVSLNSDFDYLDRSAEIFSGNLEVMLASNTGIGAEGYCVFTNYDDNELNDSDNYSVGGFIETQVTNYLRVRAAAGYQWINFDRAFVDFFGIRLFKDQADTDGYYANILITHQLNAQFQHSVSAGHEKQLGVNSNFIELNYFRYTVSWNLIRSTLLSAEGFYEDANESGGFIDEHLHRYGAAVTLGYQLTPHVTLGARYQYTQKDSDVLLRDYKQNRVSIDGTYSF